MGGVSPLNNVLDRILGCDYLLSDSPESLAQVRYVRALDKRRFYLVAFAGVQFALVAVRDDTVVTPPMVQHELRRVAAAAGQVPVAVYWEHPSAAQAEEMRRLGIPYLTAAGGCFLPFLWLNIPASEWPAAPACAPVEENSPLSPCAQVIVLRQLLFGDVAGGTIRALSRVLPYSAGLLSKAKDELVSCGLCSYPAGTRSGRFIFPEDRHDLWLRAEPWLRSPVRRSFVTRSADALQACPAAGISALAMASDLVDDPVPTCAFYQRFNADCPQPARRGEGGVCLQQWIYPPAALMHGGSRRVDDLSLYLSLRSNHDPRVRLALESLHLP